MSRPLVVGGDVLSTGQINVGSGLGPQDNETAPLIHVVGQMDGLVKIGTSLGAAVGAAGIDIDPVGGLSGQIIVNSSNTTGTWTGDVLINTLTVSPEPYYDEQAWQLGDGAVGLAPFNCHDTDCRARERRLDGRQPHRRRA